MSRLYLEPGTDGPAAQDWSTALIVAEERSVARLLTGFAVLLPLAVVVVAVLPVTVGNVGAVTVLALLGSCGLTGPPLLLGHRRRRPLLARPWRRCAATAAAPTETAIHDRLIVFEGEHPLVLRGTLPDVPDLVLNQQELFLVGPDEKGRALIRVAGLCQMFPVRVDPAGARPKERVPGLPDGRPHPRAFRRLRLGTHAWRYTAAVGVLGAVVLVLGLWPLSPVALVVGGALLAIAAVSTPIAVRLGRYYAQAVAAAEAATGWTSLPITLFPWEPTNVVAGLVQLPGRTALVQFPLPNLDVIANIADTGVIWIWGTPSDVVAVGAPRLPVLTVAVLQSDRDEPPEDPQPWLVRGYDPGLREIPALRR